jgi:hypothetical protein
MKERPKKQNVKRNPDVSEAAKKFPGADLISLETVVNLLVRKDICTPDELFEEEKKRKMYQEKMKNVTIVRTVQSEVPGDGQPNKRQQSWLKRKMSKRRWSRRLGTVLFGWRWKKVTIDRKAKNMQDG